MHKCKRCGEENPQEALFCKECGFMIADEVLDKSNSAHITATVQPTYVAPKKNNGWIIVSVLLGIVCLILAFSLASKKSPEVSPNETLPADSISASSAIDSTSVDTMRAVDTTAR